MSDPDIYELIDHSSLGSPEAKAARSTVTPEQARRVVALTRYLEAASCPEGHDFCPGHHLPIRRCWFREEAKGRCVLAQGHDLQCLLEGDLQ